MLTGVSSRYPPQSATAVIRGFFTPAAMTRPTPTMRGTTSRRGTLIFLTENMGCRPTISRAIRNVQSTTSQSGVTQWTVEETASMAGMSTAPAAAGVGIPTKYRDACGCGLISGGGGVPGATLTARAAAVNRASRSAEQRQNVMTAARPSASNL